VKILKRRDRCNVICLWFQRAGFQVVDYARPRLHTDALTTNHGGIVVAATSGVRLSVVDLSIESSTFKLQCMRIVSSASSFITATIYRPGSVAKSTTFFTYMSDVVDRLATFIEPVLLIGDVNIWLQRSTDSENREKTVSLQIYWLRMVSLTVRRLLLTTLMERWMSSRCVLTCYRCKWTSYTLICWITVCFEPISAVKTVGTPCCVTNSWLFDVIKSSAEVAKCLPSSPLDRDGILKVLADIIRARDSGHLALLTLLDLSAAFDTVDHVTLLRHLEVSYGISDTVYNWFTSYLSSRRQYVRSWSTRSIPSLLPCCLEHHKGRSLVRSFSCCTRQTYLD